MNQSLLVLGLAAMFGTSGVAQAENAWSAQDYDLYAGDFNGDGVADLLYIAHDPSQLNGIALSDGEGFNIALQSWGNAYLGIPWSSGEYNIVVADFDGDGRDDLFLQRRSAGDHFLLLTEDGGIGGISQTIPQDAMGLAWSADARRIVAGDFNGDQRSDLFLQPTDAAGLSAIVLADTNGQFTTTNPDQSWKDGYAGFNWATVEARAFAGDFDGDGRDDLLLQAEPLAGTGPGTKNWAVFPPNLNGVVLARDDKEIFATESVQAWSEDGFDAHWSPLRSALVVGDFNGDGRSDVLLQGFTVDDPSYLLYGKLPGAIFDKAAALDVKAMPSADQARLVAGRFLSAKSDALYFQSLDSSKDNYVGSVTDAGISIAMSDAALALTAEEAAASSGSNPGLSPVGGGGAAALLTVTSAGRTPAQFAVSALGGASYQIPIWTPPGARGIEPNLALVYMSGGADGPLGPGWNLAGLSVLARCGKTYASSAGSPAPVALTTGDDICLDGNRLRRTSGTQLVAGSTYQTEIANFSRTTAFGTAGSGPSYFIVEGKDGLKYEYGNTADSKAYANAGTTPYAWMLNKVLDRQGNNLKITYSTTSGDIQPSTISYTQTPATGTTYPYTVSFTYQTRVTNLSKYVAGGNILQTKVLSKINVQNSGTSVRQYNLTYASAPTTIRDRLASVQECGGSLGTDCLRATTMSYQDGTAGVASPTTVVLSSVAPSSTHAIDVDADGRTDLAYSIFSAGSYHWYVAFATTTGGYGAPVDTGVVTTDYTQLVGDFYGDGKNELIGVQGGNWYVTRWNGSSFISTSTATAFDATSSNVVADTNGDGLTDLVTLRTNGGIYIRLNTSSGTTPSLGAASLAYSLGVSPTGGDAAIYTSPAVGFSNIGTPDFNGDGRQDIVAWRIVTVNQADFERTTLLISNGTTFTTSPDYPNGQNILGFVNFNNDNCSDIVFATTTRISTCNGSDTVTVPFGSGVPKASLDWDGDGRSDVLVSLNGTIQVYRSLGSAFSTAIATGFPAGNESYRVSDSNGDGLPDLVKVIPGISGGGITYGPHNGASTPADLATTIADGWGISASPTYTPITQNNYTKNTDATFPETDFIGPLYVVSQAQQSDGLGGTFTNSFWYYGAWVNRQGRGFVGFEKTRMQDSRNSLYHDVTYRRDYPYIGRVAQDDLFQPDGTSLITRTVNAFNVIDLAGAGCTSAISATNRCFPYVEHATVATHDITVGTPLIQTAVTDVGYDTYGNPTSMSTTTTDNDSNSPFVNSSWSSVVSNTYVNNVTQWCLGRPTTTTTQNTVPGQPSATRRVDHAVDATNCRFTSETVEPLSTTLKVVTTFTYATAACGNVSSASVVGLDKNGVAMPARVTSSGYGTRCQFSESVTNPLNEVTNIAYNYNYGQKASTTDANGVAVSWLYDNFAQLTRENRPDSTYTTWAYADCVSASCWGAADLRLQVTESQYDTTSAVIRSRQQFSDAFERIRFDEGNRVLGMWTNTHVVYDGLGRKLDVYQPYSASNNGYHHFGYDILNRPIADKLYNASGGVDRETTMAYAGLKTTLTDAKSNQTEKWTDVTGKLRQIKDPAPGSGVTNYTYDPFGNLTQMQDASVPMGAVTSYTYNIRGFKTAASDPDTGNLTFTPNSLNELVAQADNKNQNITFDYDKLGRLISRLEPESATPTTWTYGTSAALHEIGRLKSLSKPDGYAEAYTFDFIGRPASVTYTEDTTYQVNYTYNSVGAVDTVTYPTSTSGYRFALKYLYSYGFLQQVKDNAAGTVFWSLSSANDYSSPITELLGNAVTITSGYTPWTNDLTSRQVGSGGSMTNLQNLAYLWDLNGNLQQRQDLAQSLTEVFTHDELNRLKTSTLNSVQNLSVNYDAAGNITTKSDVGSYNYTTNQAGCSYTGLPAQPHAVRNAGGAVYCYDKNGNMTSRGGSAISWYSYNQPNSIASGSNSTQFNYDANHQRWKQVAVDTGSTTTTYYVGGILEKVIRPTGVTEYRHAIPAGSGTAIYTRRSDATNSTYYVTTDHLGSGDLVLSSSGTVLARESFTPFGERRGSNWQGLPSAGDKAVFVDVTRRGFTGHEMLDAVNLIHMNGRVYDPHLGRFLSADPIIQTISLSQALNPFSYVMNNPLTLIDPSGYSWLSSVFHAIGHIVKSFFRALSEDLNVIVGVVLIVVGAYTYNTQLVQLGIKIASLPVHATYKSGRFGVGVRINIGGVAVNSGQAWGPGGNSGPPPTWGGGYGVMAGVPVLSWNATTLPDQIYQWHSNFEVRPPDADGYLTFGEATWQWRHGNGARVDVDVAKLDLSKVRSTDFNGPGSTLLFSTAMPWDFLVHGSITLRMNADGTVGAITNRYDFDMKTWSEQTFWRNIATAIGSEHAGPGQPFYIHFNGSVLVR